jgi:RHH-type proline utilization regulon transcriptional repressor/proline dehydrogenase/delta 1-pyrroline-5-carboxylate dehydrogenase
MRMLGQQFVTGQDIEEALARSHEPETRGYRYSYDMLGEAALTADDAGRYFAAYVTALHAIGKASAGRGVRTGPGMSVKLSALHPRYGRAQRQSVMDALLPRLRELACLAQRYQVGLNIDAEEADRLELSMELLEALVRDPALQGFTGLGFVVQAYQKRCPYVIDWLVDLARRSGQHLMVRLVKGAYWDAEIKRAQVDGMVGYPVFTRKVHTDLAYLACAHKLLQATNCIYPQFATHNAYSLAVIATWAGEMGVDAYEFQCLHGMGEALYDEIVGPDKLNRPCRIYAPVGSHGTLLAYLVRRLLENGANTSFVNQIVDPAISVDALIADPFVQAAAHGAEAHPRIPLPARLYGPERDNSPGLDLASELELNSLYASLVRVNAVAAAPLLAAAVEPAPPVTMCNPARLADIVGSVSEATLAQVETALQAAEHEGKAWGELAAAERALRLRRAADLLVSHRAELLALAVREAGKSLPNAVSEHREAVDFLRYYAARILDEPLESGPLGPVACISPWNFPLAIFVGQVAAALAAGNPVLAKPAEQTPLMAFRTVQLLHEAGIPRAALQYLPGRGDTIGAALVADPRVRGVIFTGSTEVAQILQATLTRRSLAEQCDLPLIAETGGQNAMVVDSSALPEQVVQDVLASAFDSAGQRCSALRVLFLQEEIADRVLTMLKGAMAELRVGEPEALSTDVGPVIDDDARRQLLDHMDRMHSEGRLVYQRPIRAEIARQGHFIAPTVFEINDLAQLPREVFGPILHVIRYPRQHLAQVVQAINATGYGLTLGIHSRIDETIDFISQRARVGNIYVNRNIIGAVVGVQPFGGEGKSGTGPKAGGPLYLKRLLRNPAPPLVEPALPQAAGLASFTAWAGSLGFESVLGLVEHYVKHAMSGHRIELPGPTGELNRLAFVPRGSILCAARSVYGLLNQLAAVIASGNEAWLAPQTALPAGLPDAVSTHIHLVRELRELPEGCQIALVEQGTASALRHELAQRKGALISVIMTTDKDLIPIWRLSAERHLCTNTTAAGGNASLMTLNS